LGNKRKLVPRIAELVHAILEPGQTVVDLFAGSCVVGRYLLGDFRVIANDVEHFSYCIARALIEDCDHAIGAEETTNLLWHHYRRNFEELSPAFREILAVEDEFLQKPHAFRKYGRFCTDTPYIGEYRERRCSTEMISVFERAQIGARDFPYCLFSTYFMNSYFGVRQCLQIDSIRYAIDQVAGPCDQPQNEVLFYKFITALIYAASRSVSSPGHFAQHNVPNNRNINRYLLRERSKDIWSGFLACVDELFANPLSNGLENLALKEDARSLLLPSSPYFHMISRNSLVYADPPYTGDQYSRYYHVLNTLALYDYPACEGRGRYRSDRYVSPFSLRSRAQAELNLVLANAAAASVPVILSYLDDGLVSLEALADLCNTHFRRVEKIEIDYNHSNQGRAAGTCSRRKARRKEMLYVCLP